jgi:hypothetical protein
MHANLAKYTRAAVRTSRVVGVWGMRVVAIRKVGDASPIRQPKISRERTDAYGKTHGGASLAWRVVL